MLSVKNRLRSGPSFALVREKGKLLQSQNLALNVFDRGEGNPSRFGVIVSTKISKSAVVRNKIKRAIREGIRKNSESIKRGVDAVFLVRSSILKLKNDEIIVEVEKILKNANLI